MKKAVLVPLIIATALFMEKADATIIATALPAIAADLGERPAALTLAITSYLIALAVFIPASGWIADRYGARNVFRLALAVFMAGSLACAMAGSLAEFVAARFLQGAGASMMTPVGRIVLLRSVDKSGIVAALALLSAPALLGTVSGPLLGGLITTWFDWRWIFLINIPIGMAGIVLATRFIDDIPEADAGRLDGYGFLLSGSGLALLLLGVSSIGAGVAAPFLAGSACLAGVLLLSLYVRHARRAPSPLLRLSLFAIPTFRAGVLGGALFRTGAGAIPVFLLPMMLQIGFGMSAADAGAITFISGVGALFTKTLATRILRGLGFRLVLAVNAVLASAFVASYGLFNIGVPLAVMLGALFIGGCLRSLQFTALSSITCADVRVSDLGAATSLYTVAQHISLAMGVAIGALALQATASWRGGGAALIASDFPPAFLCLGLLSASSLLLLGRLPPNAGDELAGRGSSAAMSRQA